MDFFLNFVFLCKNKCFLIWQILTHIILEKAMATHSSTLAWKIPQAEEPGRLQSMGSQRVGHNWASSLSLFTFMLWRRKCQATPVFLPGESQGWGSLVGCRVWGRTESDTTEWLHFHFTFTHWRRKWQPTPLFLPGESQGRGSLVAAVYGITQSWTLTMDAMWLLVLIRF